MMQTILDHYSNICRPQILSLDAAAENFADENGGSCRRIVAENGEVFRLCRRPEGQRSRQQIEFMQAVLWASRCEGIHWLPLPYETNDGKGYVEHRGFFWELLPWFAGDIIPFDETIRPEQRFSLVEAVAEFHRATESFPTAAPATGVSPRVLERNRQWKHWVREKFSKLDAVLSGTVFPEVACAEMIETSRRFLRSAFDQSGRLISILARASRIAVALQPVLQSLYRRHLIFSDDRHRINGLIDCSEMGIDTPAVDLAMIGTHIAPWDAVESIDALARYRHIRNLSDNEYYLMVALYHAETVMYPLDKLAKLFLPNESGSLAAPDTAQITILHDELRWALGVAPWAVGSSQLEAFR